MGASPKRFKWPKAPARVLFLDHSLVYESDKYYNLAGQLLLANAIARGAADEDSRILQIHHMDDEEALAAIEEAAPDMLALSSYVWNANRFLALAAKLKARRPVLPIVLGGPSATAITRGLYGPAPGLDMVIAGEGEEVFTRLLLEGPKTTLPGLFHQKDGAFIQSAPTGAIADLTTLTSPFDRRLKLDYPMVPALFEFARGCPYACSYCSWPSNDSRKLRSVGMRRMRGQIAWALEHGIPRAWIVDAAINYDRQVLEDLLIAFRSEDPRRRIGVFLFLKFEFVAPGQIERICNTLNAYDIHMPIESTNLVALRQVRRPFSARRFEAAIKEVKAQGVTPSVELLLGLPGDSLQGFMKSLYYLLDLEVNINVFTVVAYPGSKVFDQRDQFGFTLSGGPMPFVLATPTFPREDMERARLLVRDVSAELRRRNARHTLFMEGPESFHDEPQGPKLGALAMGVPG